MRPALVLSMLLCANAAPAQDRPPPRPDDPEDFIRYIFEVNDCVMTESQVLEAYTEAGYGIMGANDAVIAVSNRDDIEVLSRAPFRYRYYGSDYCNF